MGAFEDAAETLFGNDDMALTAQYQVGGIGAGVTIRAIRRRGDATLGFGLARTAAAAVVLVLRVTEVAAPAAGDAVTIGAVRYEIMGSPVRDVGQLFWTCEVKEG